MRDLILPIQYLRGVAAALVVVGHILEMVRAYAGNYYGDVTYLVRAIGGAGVDIFFVISGFIVVFIAGSQQRSYASAKDFFIRRMMRIVPVYWVYTGIYFYLNSKLHSDSVLNLQEITWGKFWNSIFFVNYVGYPVLEVGWTLMYEFYFYLLFSISLLSLRSTYRSWWVGGMLLLLAMAGVFFSSNIPGSVFIHGPGWLAFAKNPVLIEFLLGIVVGELFLARRLLSSRYALLAMLLGAGGIIVSGLILQPIQLLHWRYLIWGVPGFFLVYGAVSFRSVVQVLWLRRLGDMSYSLYLCHSPVLLMLVWFSVNHLQTNEARFWFLMCVSPIAIYIVSLLSYSLLEKSLGKWFLARLGYSKR